MMEEHIVILDCACNANARAHAGVAPGHAVATTTQKATFTVHEISVNVNMCFQSLNNMISAIRKIQFGLPKSGNTKVCHANGSST